MDGGFSTARDFAWVGGLSMAGGSSTADGVMDSGFSAARGFTMSKSFAAIGDFAASGDLCSSDSFLVGCLDGVSSFSASDHCSPDCSNSRDTIVCNGLCMTNCFTDRGCPLPSNISRGCACGTGTSGAGCSSGPSCSSTTGGSSSATGSSSARGTSDGSSSTVCGRCQARDAGETEDGSSSSTTPCGSSEASSSTASGSSTGSGSSSAGGLARAGGSSAACACAAGSTSSVASRAGSDASGTALVAGLGGALGEPPLLQASSTTQASSTIAKLACALPKPRDATSMASAPSVSGGPGAGSAIQLCMAVWGRSSGSRSIGLHHVSLDLLISSSRVILCRLRATAPRQDAWMWIAAARRLACVPSCRRRARCSASSLLKW
mmetsp:Transcript_87530/g.225467  ORF Transcript_87530/g.225467 Transcript_87530/m.225467 type:complete len:378 (-) Transcript_87530:572-1705(-)